MNERVFSSLDDLLQFANGCLSGTTEVNGHIIYKICTMCIILFFTNGCFNYVQNKTEPVTKRWFYVSLQTILEVYNS